MESRRKQLRIEAGTVEIENKKVVKSMRRHERPRTPGFRVERPVRGKWCDLSLAQKRQHVQDQLKQLGRMDEQPKITCLCGKTVPAMYAYRCFMCGAFWCPKCAGKHFEGDKKCK